MTASIAAEIRKDVRVMRFPLPPDGSVGAHCRFGAYAQDGATPRSNANNTTKLRRLAASLAPW
ncbi:MAG TPA: hypothetical protein VGP86_06030 [Xanthobacteraceae bacterium]|jgi:hypothetical protein|nr:hypothetical protein [Xanthobacteraceae bacterium]